VIELAPESFSFTTHINRDGAARRSGTAVDGVEVKHERLPFAFFILRQIQLRCGELLISELTKAHQSDVDLERGTAWQVVNCSFAVVLELMRAMPTVEHLMTADSFDFAVVLDPRFLSQLRRHVDCNPRMPL
jgi:hypothetical protein